MTNALPLARRVILVTGGGSGIGLAAVQKLAALGAIVYAADLRPPAASGDIHPITLDVTDAAAVTSAIDEIGTTHSRIDAVCNVAGVMDGYLGVHETDEETWRTVLGVNLDGAFHVCRAALRWMLEAQSGCIVNVSSAAGIRGGTAGAAYTVSKHAICGLSRSIAWTYATSGIRCNTVLPGGTKTPLSAALTVRSEFGHERSRRILRNIVRMAEPSEIADVIVWLLGDTATAINGAEVAADSGWMAG